MEILAKTMRGNVIDLVYTGHIAVMDYQGKQLYYAGNPDYVAFTRSSAKFMQAMVPVMTGAADAFKLTEQEISQICASHNGEALHIETVGNILKKLGLDESYLKCGPDYPLYAPAKQAMIDRHEKPRDIHNNCSGKHSGMLTTTKFMNEDLSSYYKFEHPHQKRITKVISRLCQYPEDKIELSLDGCGVPVHALPVAKFAFGMARLCKPDCLDADLAPAATRITQAVMKYPFNTSGTDRIDLRVMEKYPGKVVMKSGANGYYTGGFPGEGIAFAIKIDDGNANARNAVAIDVLHQLGLIPDKDMEYFTMELNPKDYNHRKEFVGSLSPCVQLKKGK